MTVSSIALLWDADSKLRIFIFKTISKALQCECLMYVYLESKLKGPVFPIRCPRRKGAEADDFGRTGHFAEQ